VAYAVVQSQLLHVSATATSLAVTFTTSNVVLGNRIVAFGTFNAETVTTGFTCADGGSNSYDQHAILNGNSQTSALFSLVVPANIAGTKPTITFTFPSCASQTIAVMEVSGLNAVNGAGALDGSATASGTSATALGTMPSASTGSGNAVLNFFADSGNNFTITKDASYTQDYNNSPVATLTLAAEDKASTSGTTETGTWTMSSEFWFDFIASFLLAPGGVGFFASVGKPGPRVSHRTGGSQGGY